MDINQLFPSNYLKASDLQGQPRRVVIQSIAPEDLGQGEVKPVAHFLNVPRGLVLNKTNGMLLAAAFGNETDGWTGKEIELYQDNVVFQGRVVPAIRVRTTAAQAAPAVGAFDATPTPAPQTAANPQPATAPPAQADQTQAAAPPSNADRAQPPVAEQAAAPQAALPLDDDIPW